LSWELPRTQKPIPKGQDAGVTAGLGTPKVEVHEKRNGRTGGS